MPALVSGLLELHSKRLQLPLPEVTDVAMKKLRGYHWPGNVRELANQVLRWLLLRLRRVTENDLTEFAPLTSPLAGGSSSLRRTTRACRRMPDAFANSSMNMRFAG